ncbi:NAD(P)H-dependent oxidoreductase [Roseateles saccharophilus]|uniref:Kef-type potassium/proton antiporter accessory protein (CPA2 family) n=1 Tax=Roseateles saccharophilus TaxID=304 RepID=A0A4V2VPH5_ROSSA|nr:NAD(P)H-dependent oxidoreductase [Roseateles saccharophilus]MDG0834356.1 NAD(P)H dehydrogenase [Roseateles saccharophilus]TCU90719.1 Kef-type potassium/proton antiporter accessory protein (CPA2 family) [Roseateles saccharophilus]
MPDSSPRDILVLAAHPDLARSQATRTVLDALRASPAAGRVELRDLYRLYPDFHIHVEAEQRALQAAKLVVLLHPIYWYSMPALQKLWLDEVLRLGWAYGPGGTALHGKDFWLVTSTGGGSAAYAEGGHNHHAIGEFLLPYQQSAKTCGMHYLPPQILHGAHRATDAGIAAHAELFVKRLQHYPDWCQSLAAPEVGDEEAVELDERPPMFSALDGGAAE